MKKLKLLLILLVFIPCVVFITGCSLNPEKYVVGIERASQSTEFIDVYTIKYSDGSTSSFSVENGKDGEDLNIQEIYNVAKENGYSGTFLEFLDDYLDLTVNKNDTVSAVNKAMFSSVIISCEFPITSGNFLQQQKDIGLGSGSGVIYKLDKSNGDAYIITNYHVVYNSSCHTADRISDKIVCYLYGSDTSRTKKVGANNQIVYGQDGYPIVEYTEDAISCEYIGGSMLQDIAVLKISGSQKLKNSNATQVEIADSNNIEVGSTAIAIGNPSGEGFSATQGIVSVDSEYLAMKGADDITNVTVRVMRIDTPVNSGNSGGGLYNIDGNLIGIVNAKVIEENIENIGYAIPSNVAKAVADNIIKNASNSIKCAKKATIGITLKAENSRAVYDENADTIKIVQDIYIDEITSGSIASNSDLRVGDKVVSATVKGQKYEIYRLFHLIDIVWLLDDGDVMYLEIEGKSSPVMVEITLDSINLVQ